MCVCCFVIVFCLFIFVCVCVVLSNSFCLFIFVCVCVFRCLACFCACLVVLELFGGRTESLCRFFVRSPRSASRGVSRRIGGEMGPFPFGTFVWHFTQKITMLPSGNHSGIESFLRLRKSMNGICRDRLLLSNAVFLQVDRLERS